MYFMRTTLPASIWAPCRPLPSRPMLIAHHCIAHHCPRHTWACRAAGGEDALTPGEQLLEMTERVRQMTPEQQQQLLNMIQQELEASGTIPPTYAESTATTDNNDLDALYDALINENNDDNNDENNEDDENNDNYDDGWRELQPWELPENIKQLFREAGWEEDAIEDVGKSAGPGDEVPMPWRSDFYGDLVDTKLPKAMGMVDGEPAYFDVPSFQDQAPPWDTPPPPPQQQPGKEPTQKPSSPCIPDTLPDEQRILYVDPHGTVIPNDQFDDEPMPDMDAEEGPSPGEVPLPIQVKERMEEHLRGLERGERVVWDERYTAVQPEDGESLLARINTLQTRYEDTHLPKAKRAFTLEEQRAMDEAMQDDFDQLMAVEDDTGDIKDVRPAPKVAPHVEDWFYRCDWITYLLRRQHIDGHVDGPVRALIQADLVTEDVVYQDQAVQLTGVHKWLQYMKALVAAGARCDADISTCNNMGTSRPIPEMEVVVDYFMHIPWPVWYKQYIVHVTGSAMPAQPEDTLTMVHHWQQQLPPLPATPVGYSSSAAYIEEKRFAYDHNAWEGGEVPAWTGDDAFFTQLMGEFESSAAQYLSKQPQLSFKQRDKPVQHKHTWLSGECFTIALTTRYGIDVQAGKVNEVQTIWGNVSGFTGELTDIYDVYLVVSGLYRWRFDHDDQLTILPTYRQQHQHTQTMATPSPDTHVSYTDTPSSSPPRSPPRWYRLCQRARIESLLPSSMRNRRMVVHRHPCVVQPGRTEGYGGLTRPGGDHVLLSPWLVQFQEEYLQEVEEEETRVQREWNINE